MTTSPAKLVANKKWADGNKEKVKAYKLAYYIRNGDLVNEKNKNRNKATYAKKKEAKRVAIQAEADLRANTIANIPIEVFAELLLGLNLSPEMLSGIQSDLVAGVKMGLSADKLAKSHAILINTIN